MIKLTYVHNRIDTIDDCSFSENITLDINNAMPQSKHRFIQPERCVNWTQIDLNSPLAITSKIRMHSYQILYI